MMNSSRTPWTTVAILCGTATAGYICRVNVSTAGALLMQEFNLSQVSMGRIFSAFLLGYALFQVPAGILADRIGSRRVFAIITWLWVVLTALQVIVGWKPAETNIISAVTSFMVLRFLLGISAAPTYPAAAHGISGWIPVTYQARANGIVIASIGLGSALAPPIVSNIMVIWGWRTALFVSSLPALAIALVWLRIRDPERLTHNHLKSNEINSSVQNITSHRLWSKSFIFLTISYTLQGYVGYIFVSWFYLYLVQERQFDLLDGAWMSSLPWILSIVSIPLGGFASDWISGGRLGPAWGRRLVPMVGMAFSGVLISIGAHTGSPVLAAISLAFATAFILCVEGPFWAMMMQIAKVRSGTAGGIMNFGSNLGGLISPILTPLLASYIGWEYALHIAGGLAVIGALLWLGVSQKDID